MSIRHKTAIAPTIIWLLILFLLYRSSMPAPTTMMPTERQASAETIASRMVVRLLKIAESSSGGIPCMLESIWCSFSVTKGPIILGASATNVATPAVSSKLAITYLRLLFAVRTSGSSFIFFSIIMANSGMVNSAMTRIEATVRNFAYIGT